MKGKNVITMRRELRSNGATMLHLTIFPPSTGGIVENAIREAHNQGKFPDVILVTMTPLVVSLRAPTKKAGATLNRVKKVLRENPSTSKIEIIEDGSKSG